MRIICCLVFFLSFSSFASNCWLALEIGTNDRLYPGQGEVSICLDKDDNLMKIVIVKPVKHSAYPDKTSSQFDVRNPIVEISVNELNMSNAPIVIMKPKRLQVEIAAATVSLFNGARMNPVSGGKVLLRVVKSKVFNSYHELILNLEKINGKWRVKLQEGKKESPIDVRGLYFKSSLDGISEIDIY